MRAQRFLVLVVGLAALLVAALSPASAVGGRPIAVEMTGAAERPGPGDPDGSGTAWFWINHGQGTFCYVLEVEGIEPATAAHVHVAPPSAPGPVVIPLAAPTSGTASGCVDVDRDLLRAILIDPGDYYVNVHNASFPAGAVRGQLSR